MSFQVSLPGAGGSHGHGSFSQQGCATLVQKIILGSVPEPRCPGFVLRVSLVGTQHLHEPQLLRLQPPHPEVKLTQHGKKKSRRFP